MVEKTFVFYPFLQLPGRIMKFLFLFAKKKQKKKKQKKRERIWRFGASIIYYISFQKLHFASNVVTYGIPITFCFSYYSL